MRRRTYDWLYRVVRLLRVPIGFVFGDHPELSRLVEGGELQPGRAVDLGCGAGREAIYLASRGFEVTGVDYSPTAIGMARRAATEAGVEVEFLVDDLTEPKLIEGEFDVLVDYGVLNDLRGEDRDRYVDTVLDLTRAGSKFVLMCFDKHLPSEEIHQRFRDHFDVQRISHKTEQGVGRAISAYLMTRNSRT